MDKTSPATTDAGPYSDPQVCQVSAQQPVQTELLMRHHQLQSRLATLKIENEEVRANGGVFLLSFDRQSMSLPSKSTRSAGFENGFQEGL